MLLKLVVFTMLIIHRISVAEEDSPPAGILETKDDSEYFSKCYDEIGCIETDTRWYDKKKRPVNLHPLERHIIKTDFILIKPDTKVVENPDTLLYDSVIPRHASLNATGFKSSSNLMILIHDYTSNGYTGWVKHLAMKVITESMDFNIISVDWQRGAEPPYDQAISNARVVALEIINIIKEIKEGFSYSLDNIHMVGHGVGAHIAGYVGMTFNDIGKITGLDPSGVRFEGMPEIVRLNPNAAKYVEVIHTDAFEKLSQGTKEPMGHSDFYVNNAEQQLGCSRNTPNSGVFIDKNSLPDGDILPGCSHKRSFKYFIESLNTRRCSFLGIQCENIKRFHDGLCTTCGESNERCRTFGTRTYKNSIQNILLFLNAGDREPFCMFQYKISVILEKPGKSYTGYFDFILVDDAGNAVEASPSYEPNYKNISGGSNNTFVYYGLPPQMTSIKEAKVRWNEKKKLYCFIYCQQYIEVAKIHIVPIGILERPRKTSTLCATEGVKIDNGAYKKFNRCGEKIPSSAKEEITFSTSAMGHVSSVSSIEKASEEAKTIYEFPAVEMSEASKTGISHAGSNITGFSKISTEEMTKISPPFISTMATVSKNEKAETLCEICESPAEDTINKTTPKEAVSEIITKFGTNEMTEENSLFMSTISTIAITEEANTIFDYLAGDTSHQTTPKEAVSGGAAKEMKEDNLSFVTSTVPITQDTNTIFEFHGIDTTRASTSKETLSTCFTEASTNEVVEISFPVVIAISTGTKNEEGETIVELPAIDTSTKATFKEAVSAVITTLSSNEAAEISSPIMSAISNIAITEEAGTVADLSKATSAEATTTGTSKETASEGTSKEIESSGNDATSAGTFEGVATSHVSTNEISTMGAGTSMTRIGEANNYANLHGKTIPSKGETTEYPGCEHIHEVTGTEFECDEHTSNLPKTHSKRQVELRRKHSKRYPHRRHKRRRSRSFNF